MMCPLVAMCSRGMSQVCDAWSRIVSVLMTFAVEFAAPCCPLWPASLVGYTKLHLWRLTQYSKLVYIDADAIVLRNVDEVRVVAHVIMVAIVRHPVATTSLSCAHSPMSDDVCNQAPLIAF